MRNDHGFRGAGRRVAAGSVVLAAALLGACDFDVTNPGPVEDRFLDRTAAHDALVSGMGRMFGAAINWVGYSSAAVTRELHPAGSTGAGGITPNQQLGLLVHDEGIAVGTPWENSHRARWAAEDGIRRLERVLGNDFNNSPHVARAYLWAGYSNRLLGENFCYAVIDGGAPEPSDAHLVRAEEQFTAAMEIAGRAGLPQVVMAARAARASVRAHRGQWAGAVADAAGVPENFVFVVPMHDMDDGTLGEAQYNYIFLASANSPYRAHTVWNTVNEDYYLATGDPRVRWGRNPAIPEGDAAVGPLGRVPWFFQLKYPRRDSDIRLSTGREMRLIEAEALLVSGDWQGAVTILNRLRAGVTSDTGGQPIPAVQATSPAEAWTLLRRERGIELWLEARRLGDIRRWRQAARPGALHTLEEHGGRLPLRPDRNLCFPVSIGERETNPNVPLDFQSDVR
jgi:starch-binding outer membrane protein, SusD/RagB family